MSGDKTLVPSSSPEDDDLAAELQRARQELREADARLAEMQAEINAFRMHCRLKLDAVVDRYQALRARKQSLLTKRQLLCQAQELGVSFDDLDPLLDQPGEFKQWEEKDDVLLPTDTPRDKAAEKRLYRELARRFHPDLGKSAVEISYRTAMMSAINSAFSQDNIQALYDLAGKLDPAEIAQLSAIKDVEARRIRRQILKSRQLRRRSQHRLKDLLQENTSRLWKLAQEHENAGKDWWRAVEDEIEMVNRRRAAEILVLEEEIAAFLASTESGGG